MRKFRVDISEIKERKVKGKYTEYYISFKVPGEKRKRKETASTKEALLDKLDKIERDIRETGMMLINRKVKMPVFIEEVKEDILEDHQKTAGSTSVYLAALKRIAVGMSDKNINELSDLIIENYLKEQREILKYSTSSVSVDIYMIRLIITEAKKRGLISKNELFFQLFDKAKYTRKRVSDPEAKAISSNLRDDYLKMLQTSIYSTFFHVLYRTGIRFGEAIALTANDIYVIERNGKRIHLLDINKQLVYNKKIGIEREKEVEKFMGYLRKEDSAKIGKPTYKIQKVKTKKGSRKIVISQETYEMIVNHIKENKKKNDRANAKYNLDLIFISPNSNNVLRNNNVNKHLALICEKHNLEEITCHTMRRTLSTRAFENGINEQIIKATLGHSGLTTTFSYNKITDNFLLDYAEEIDKIT